MQAYQLTAWQQPPELRDIDVPEPGPGQVLVKVGGAGACHSDLHLMEWPEGTMPFEPPFTLGHENAGWVEQLGAGVTGFTPGDPVAVYGPWGCGHCRGLPGCRRRTTASARATSACSAEAWAGRRHDRVHARALAAAAGATGDLDPRDAAPLTDAALTPYHAIKRSLHLLVPGSTALVIGVGGLGHMGVQILRALSPGADRGRRHVGREARAGPSGWRGPRLEAGDSAGPAIRELTGGRGAELVVDMVGSDDSLALERGSPHSRAR